MTNDAAMERSTLVGIKMVVGKLATSYTANRVDEVSAVEIFEPILVGIVRIGVTVKVHR